jgi:hypothetical protein
MQERKIVELTEVLLRLECKECHGSTSCPPDRVERAMPLSSCQFCAPVTPIPQDVSWKAEVKKLANALMAIKGAQETKGPESPKLRLSFEIISRKID